MIQMLFYTNMELLQLPLEVYPYLIRAFYQNLKEHPSSRRKIITETDRKVCEPSLELLAEDIFFSFLVVHGKVEEKRIKS